MVARTKKTTVERQESSDADLNNSSQGSFDAEMYIAQLAHMMTKRAQRAKAANQKVKKEVASAIEEAHESSVKRFRDGCDEITKMYERFALEQAALQDEIRTLWLQLETAHAEYMNFIDGQAGKIKVLEEERSGQHLLALSTLKRACQDYESTILNLKNTCMK